MIAAMVSRWLDRRLDDERLAMWFHVVVAVFNVCAVFYHVGWAARRHARLDRNARRRAHLRERGFEDPPPWVIRAPK